MSPLKLTPEQDAHLRELTADLVAQSERSMVALRAHLDATARQAPPVPRQRVLTAEQAERHRLAEIKKKRNSRRWFARLRRRATRERQLNAVMQNVRFKLP